MTEPRSDLPKITSVLLDQWEASALADEAAGRVWSVNPVAVLAIVARLRSLSARNRDIEAALITIRDWAFTKHGGIKSPAEVWPGLATALAAVTPPEEPT